MANNISDYLENEVLDHVCKTGAAFTQPDVYIALCTAATVDADTGATITEVANANGYARQGPISFDAAVAGLADNTADITFPAASGGAWGTVTHIALLDSGTWGAGNMLWHGALAASKVVGDGDTFKVPAGDLDLSLD